MDVPLTNAAAPKPAASNTLSQRADQVWTRDEWILALSLYLDRRDGKVTDLDQAYRELGGRLGRSPGSIPVRLFDFEAQDPASAGKKPMAAPGAVAKAVWAEFASDPDRARAEAILARERLAQAGIAGKPQARVWKISPGPQAQHWDDCLRDGIIVVGWEELGDLSRFVGSGRAAFDAEYRAKYPNDSEGTRKVQSGMLWTFLNEVREGDTVVANQGLSQVVGIGEVVGGYEYRPERAAYRHLRRVRWFDTEKRTVGSQGGWTRTLVPVSSDRYAAITGEPSSTLQPAKLKQPWTYEEFLQQVSEGELEPSDRDLLQRAAALLKRLETEGVATLDGGKGMTTASAMAKVGGAILLQFLADGGASLYPWTWGLSPERKQAQRVSFKKVVGGSKSAEMSNPSFFQDLKRSDPELKALTAWVLELAAEIRRNGAPREVAGDLVESVQASLDERGLHFGQELISAYLLALQAKRFVILTGISGTGKTQLALAVAKAFPVTSRRATPATSGESFGMTVRPYMHDHARIVLPTDLAARITRPADFESYELDLEYPGGVIKATLGNLKPDRIPDLYFRRPFTPWFAENMPLGIPFELVPTLSESGHLERLTLRLAITQEVVTLQNHAVVEVRPDWTDSRGLLGYWNPITERYHAPPFLRLLLEAREEEERAEAEGRTAAPFFVVLDEMNLARVEHYFAELLSCLESDEPLKLHDDARIESGLAADGELPIPRELKVPGNLFITGTVNIDETTHMFSPKVLDRAFVLELNDVDLGFLDSDSTRGLRLTEAPGVLQRDGRNRVAWDGFGELAAGGARETLLALHRALEVHGRHFAYRVAFDVARFVVLADEQGEGTDAAVWAALDEAVLAKVLPKLAGTQAELESLLGDLLAICTGTVPEPLLPKSARKLARMRSRLSQVGYCSFIA